MYLYHGTSTKYLSQILSQGLRPDASYKGYLCYADEIGIALYHANFMAEWEDSDPIAFRIPLKRFEHKLFCLEENFIRLGPSSGRALGKDLSGEKWTWETLLKTAGVVGYSGVMKVTENEIMDHLRPAPGLWQVPDRATC